MKITNFRRLPESNFSIFCGWQKAYRFSVHKQSILIAVLSKSENPRLGYENVRIPFDFQVAKKRTFLITKTIDFDFFCTKSEKPRFGYENIRIPYDFQVAKKRTCLITKQ